MRDIEKSVHYLQLLKEAEKDNLHCFSLNFENKNFTAWIENSEDKQE